MRPAQKGDGKGGGGVLNLKGRKKGMRADRCPTGEGKKHKELHEQVEGKKEAKEDGPQYYTLFDREGGARILHQKPG